MWKYGGTWNSKNEKIYWVFEGRFCLHSNFLRFNPLEWNRMLYFCACHWENWFTFNGCDCNWNINGYCHRRVLKLKTHFTGKYHSFFLFSFSFSSTFLFCRFYSSCLILLIFNDWKDEHNRMRFTMTKWTKRFARNSFTVFYWRWARAKWRIN